MPSLAPTAMPQSVSDLCFTACDPPSGKYFAECPTEMALMQTKSKERRARRFRRAFLAGAASVRCGPPGLVLECGGFAAVAGADRAVQCCVENFRGLPDADVLQSICERGNVPQGERWPVPVAGGQRPSAVDGISDWRDDMSGASLMVGESSATQASGIGAASVGGNGFVVSAVLPVSAPKTGPTLAFDKESTENVETSSSSLSVACSGLPRDGKVGTSLWAVGGPEDHCPVGAEPFSLKASEIGAICAALLWLPSLVCSGCPGAPVQKSVAEAEPESTESVAEAEPERVAEAEPESVAEAEPEERGGSRPESAEAEPAPGSSFVDAVVVHATECRQVEGFASVDVNPLDVVYEIIAEDSCAGFGHGDVVAITGLQHEVGLNGLLGRVDMAHSDGQQLAVQLDGYGRKKVKPSNLLVCCCEWIDLESVAAAAVPRGLSANEVIEAVQTWEVLKVLEYDHVQSRVRFIVPFHFPID